ncbi:MAG: OB-fold domain-containing protein [Immundisolibacteraceae bacterium]|nr:OB-fold domain-containing protein [Immundisolibacteraceae bacterium]
MSNQATAFPRPVPAITDVSRPYWQAAREHRLEVQRCDDCNEWIFYPRQVCSECLSSALSWRQVSGLGTVYSYTVMHVPPHPGLADDLPLIVAVVKLDEGPQLTTNIVGCEPENMVVDMPVTVYFDDIDESITLVKFKPL